MSLGCLTLSNRREEASHDSWGKTREVREVTSCLFGFLVFLFFLEKAAGVMSPEVMKPGPQNQPALWF